MHDLVGRYVDLQINGYIGIDFNDPNTPVEHLHQAASALQRDGVQAALPTVITAAPDDMLACISNLVSAIKQREETARVFRGIHLEGPFLSAERGYIGAHPRHHARRQDLGLLRSLCQAAGHYLRIVTLAPEVDPDAKMVRYCVDQGVIVAAGHTNASLNELRTAQRAGLSLFTHLGNGCPQLMNRHDNIIYRALYLRKTLKFTLIADGHHIPSMLFELLLDWIAPSQLAVVSDAISAAGLGPGTYQLGSRQITIGPDRVCRDPSGDNFAGSASRMVDADQWMSRRLQLPLALRRQLLFENPMQWLGI